MNVLYSDLSTVCKDFVKSGWVEQRIPFLMTLDKPNKFCDLQFYLRIYQQPPQ